MVISGMQGISYDCFQVLYDNSRMFLPIFLHMIALVLQMVVIGMSYENMIKLVRNQLFIYFFGLHGSFIRHYGTINYRQITFMQGL